MATTAPDTQQLDIEEQVARIRKMQVELDKAHAETMKVRVDTTLAPRAIVITALGAGAAFSRLIG